VTVPTSKLTFSQRDAETMFVDCGRSQWPDAGRNVINVEQRLSEFATWRSRPNADFVTVSNLVRRLASVPDVRALCRPFNRCRSPRLSRKDLDVELRARVRARSSRLSPGDESRRRSCLLFEGFTRVRLGL